MRKDLQKRVIFGGIALAFFIPVVLIGGVVFQIVVGLIAMLGVHELLKMKGLQTETIEGALAMLAALVLALPLESYLPFLPAGGNFIAYGLLVLLLMGTTVLAQGYTYDEVVYPIASSFYVGFGFHALIDPGSGNYALSLRAEDYGKVYFYVLEEKAEIYGQWPSFEEFLNSFVEE